MLDMEEHIQPSRNVAWALVADIAGTDVLHEA